MSSAGTGTRDRSVVPGNRAGNPDAVSWNARTYVLWMSAERRGLQGLLTTRAAGTAAIVRNPTEGSSDGLPATERTSSPSNSSAVRNPPSATGPCGL